MDRLPWKNKVFFLIKIIIPTFVPILLFYLTAFHFFLPEVEKQIMEEKEITLKELTETAWSIIEESEAAVKSGKWTEEYAKEAAIQRIKDLRYGSEHKDYFWITDFSPKMIVHPYRPELNGKDLTEYKTRDGRQIFVEAAEIVTTKGDGFLSYKWQKKDNPEDIAPKLSYVKGFLPWQWLIGTGIYLDDVNKEITNLKSKLVKVTIVIILISVLLLLLVVLHSHKIEIERVSAEKSLILSREQYKTLVSASSDGLLLFINGQCIFANDTFLKMLNCKMEDLDKILFPEIESQNDLISEEIVRYFQALRNNEELPENYETHFIANDGSAIPVTLDKSTEKMDNDEATVVLVKNEKKHQLPSYQVTEPSVSSNLQPLTTPIKAISLDAPTCSTSTPLKHAATLIRQHPARSVLVQDSENIPIGIITEHDLATRIWQNEYSPNTPSYKIMSAPLLSLPSQTSAFEAIGFMQKHKIHHIAIQSEDSATLSGIVTESDLLHLSTHSPENLLQIITNSSSVEEFSTCRQQLPPLVAEMICNGTPPAQIAQLIAAITDHIHRQLIADAVKNIGEPPVPFCFLVLGSLGRREETLNADQDNALIYQDPAPEQKAECEKYFKELSKIVCDRLNQTGLSYCNGEIMAMNPKWCASLSTWKAHFKNWITEADSEALLKINIFFDFRYIYGAPTLSENLHNYIHDLLPVNQPFFFHMANNCLLYRPPLNAFGGIQLKRKPGKKPSLSIKECLQPIVNFARLYALKHNISETNTQARLHALNKQGIINSETCTDILEVHNFLMKLRFIRQAALLRNNVTDLHDMNDIDPDTLTDLENNSLKFALKRLQVMQSKLSFDFKGGM